MRIFCVAALVVSGLLMAACQPSPPTVVYIVISPTPEFESGAANTVEADSPVTPEAAATAQPTSIPIAATTPPVTPTPDLFPTATVGQIQVAEQVYENGRMMWVQPAAQIWVMVLDERGGGEWLRYEDTFVEGEDIESDSVIVPPDGMLQPERGFGKLWRENPEIRDALGWAITPEFGYISQYEYYPGGTVEGGEFVPDFGYHVLFSLNDEAFRFEEETNRWMLGR